MCFMDVYINAEGQWTRLAEAVHLAFYHTPPFY
jgi:hypothetical protein